MKKIQLTKRIISLLSAGTIALTMGSCDSEETSKVEETTIVIETDAEETESIIAQLVTNKVSVTTVPDITSAVSSDSEPIEDTIDSSVDITIDSITETPIEDPIESTTEVTTNRPIETVETTTKPKPDVTTKPDTTKPSVVTTKPIESTTSKPIEDPIETQKVEKLTTKNINNIAAIDAIAEQAYRYVYSVNNYALFTYISYYYEGQEYVCGRDEFRLFIALLNEQHISEDTLKELFGDMSLDDIKRCSRIFMTITSAFSKVDMTINYDQFIVDNNMKLFLSEMQTKIKEYKKSGNIEEFNKYVVDFYEGNGLRINHNDNLIIDRYIYSLISISSNFYDNSKLDYLIHLNTGDTGVYNDYIVNEFYQKTRTKQLSK